MSAAPRRPIGDVIQEFADGGHYSKTTLETVARSILNAEYEKQNRPKPEAAAGAEDASFWEDVDLLVREFEVPRATAEGWLRETEGAAEGGRLAQCLERVTGVAPASSS